MALFNNEQKGTKMAKQTSYGEPQGQSINLISEGTIIKGDVTTVSDIRIDGTLIGNLKAQGRLVIGPKGKVEGDINCNNIEISGYMKGKVTVSELLTFTSTAQIYGDVVTNKLAIEPGSVFTGTCTMGGSKPVDATPKGK